MEIEESLFLAALNFFFKPGINEKNLLSTSEKQRIVYNEIMNLHATTTEEIFGYPHIKLYPGQSIVQVCKDQGIIKQLFPLHEPKELSILEKKWFAFPFYCQPIEDIRNYFGEAVGFYFAFLDFYTKALIPPALVGLLQSVITIDVMYSYIFFAILKMIWLTLFLECWKRKSNELAFQWGTLKAISLPQPHPTFRGNALQIDPVTKKHVPVYPGYKRHLKVYCISTPVVALCLVFAAFVMLIYFDVEDFVMDMYLGSDSLVGWIFIQLPGVIYALLVYVMSRTYAKLAIFLTEWENHKTQESFENHRNFKLLLFEFVNNFIAMGYIAFIRQDMELLKWQIGIMMIVNQLINQVQEALLPVVLQKCSNMLSRKQKLDLSIEESEMWPYEGTYDDYLEMFIQFGYVFLFSSVYPLAAVFAFINNILEVWADGFKLCHSYQRPKARPVKGIGIWQMAFEMLGILSVMTNCALICLSPTVQSVTANISPYSWLLIAVGVEHAIIVVKLTLAYLISDVPKWVTIQMQKARYESLQALKLERKLKTKEILDSVVEKKTL